jgi:hypothetical protein
MSKVSCFVGDDEHEAVADREALMERMLVCIMVAGSLRIPTLNLRSCLALLAHGRKLELKVESRSI